MSNVGMTTSWVEDDGSDFKEEHNVKENDDDDAFYVDGDWQ